MAFEIPNSTVKAMLHQEETRYFAGNHFQENQSNAVAGIFSSCRRQMADWCYQLADFCHFQSDTVEIAMSYLDRFLATESGKGAYCDINVYQLASMTAFYTAVKIHEPEAMDLALVSKLSRGIYTVDQVEQMEFSMLQALQWHMNPPTTLSFVRHLLELLPPTVKATQDTIYAFAKLQTQSAVRDDRFIHIKSSVIAFASIMNALEILCLDAGLFTSIGDIVAKALNMDWMSPEFSEVRSTLYGAIFKSSGFSVANTTVQSNKGISQSEFYGDPANYEASPRSLTEI